MSAFQTTTKILAAQTIITLLAALLTLFVADSKAAISALVGGGINCFATTIFAARVFAVGSGSSARQVMRAFYVGEVMKLAITIALFLLVIVWLDVLFLPLFTTYAVTMLAFWLVLLIAI